MKNKIVYVLLCLLLCVAFMPAAAFADSETPAAPDGVWTDFAAADFAGGSGTAEEPYQIATAEQLAKLAKDINSGTFGQTYSGEYFKLTADIDLSAHRWIPIASGYKSLPQSTFSGHFDGDGKTITGLYVDESRELFSAGLFGMFQGAEIMDLEVRGAYVKTESQNGWYESAGILVGVALDGNGISPSIKNCSVSGIVESGSECLLGGLVGCNFKGNYENCTADVKVKGCGPAGGFAGEDTSGSYKNCTAIGDVSGTWYVGGFAGNLHYKSTVDHCFAQGKVTAGDVGAGGFAGYVEEYAVIKNCVATGDVESTLAGEDPKAGGFAGNLNGRAGKTNITVSNSHAAGKVSSVKAGYKPGGFVGVSVDSDFASCSYDVEKNTDLKAGGGADAADINGVEAASTQKVKSNICRDYYDGKHELDEVPGKLATCTEDGVETYWECENCGLMFSDKDGKDEISSPEAIKATGHDLVKKDGKAAGSTEDGYKEYWQCSKCGKLFSDEKGQNEISSPEVIKATGAPAGDKSAATGDSSMPVIYGLLAALAAGGAAGALCIRRRKA